MEENLLNELKEIIATYYIEIIAVASALGVTIEKTPININPITCLKKACDKIIKDFGAVANQDLNNKVDVLVEKIDFNTDKITEIEMAQDFANIDSMEKYLSQRYKYSIKNGFLYNNEYKAIRALEFKYKLLIIKYENLPPGKIPDEDMMAMFRHFNSEFEKRHVRFDEPEIKHNIDPALNQNNIDGLIQDEQNQNAKRR